MFGMMDTRVWGMDNLYEAGIASVVTFVHDVHSISCVSSIKVTVLIEWLCPAN